MEEKSNIETDTMSSSSNLSNVLIGILLIVVAFLAFNFFQAEPSDSNETIANDTGSETNTNTEINQDETDSSETVDDSDNNNANETSQAEYLVEQGDSLWKIAERELNDGFLWTEIASLNNISQDTANNIEPGTYLRIPDVSGANTQEPEIQPTTNQIHIVKKGETLWSIALSYYEDGFLWNKIYELTENDITMYTPQNGAPYPLIEEGDVLVIPSVPVSS